MTNDLDAIIAGYLLGGPAKKTTPYRADCYRCRVDSGKPTAAVRQHELCPEHERQLILQLAAKLKAVREYAGMCRVIGETNGQCSAVWSEVASELAKLLGGE